MTHTATYNERTTKQTRFRIQPTHVAALALITVIGYSALTPNGAVASVCNGSAYAFNELSMPPLT